MKHSNINCIRVFIFSLGTVAGKQCKCEYYSRGRHFKSQIYMHNPSACIESGFWSDKWPLNFFYNSNSTLVLWRLQFTQRYLNFFRGTENIHRTALDVLAEWNLNNIGSINWISPGAGWEIELAQQPSFSHFLFQQSPLFPSLRE